MLYSAVDGSVHCSAVECGAVRCGAVQCSAVQCNAVRCGAVPLAGHNVWISDRVGDGDISGQKGEDEAVSGYIWTNMGYMGMYLNIFGNLRI